MLDATRNSTIILINCNVDKDADIPGGSKATMFAELGPKSTVFRGAMALTSHRITVP